MTRTQLNPPQRGVSLIEVLVTLVVLGVGLVSMAKLQPTVMENSGLARARAVAAQLAEQKIEDLRSFSQLSSGFQNIGDNSGGVFPSGSVTLSNSNVGYNRSWTVSNWYFPLANNQPAQSSTSSPVVQPAWPDFKIVTVKVTWNDQEGIPQEVLLNTIISSAEPSRTGLIVEP